MESLYKYFLLICKIWEGLIIFAWKYFWQLKSFNILRPLNTSGLWNTFVKICMQSEYVSRHRLPAWPNCYLFCRDGKGFQFRFNKKLEIFQCLAFWEYIVIVLRKWKTVMMMEKVCSTSNSMKWHWQTTRRTDVFVQTHLLRSSMLKNLIVFYLIS